MINKTKKRFWKKEKLFKKRLYKVALKKKVKLVYNNMTNKFYNLVELVENFRCGEVSIIMVIGFVIFLILRRIFF